MSRRSAASAPSETPSPEPSLRVSKTMMPPLRMKAFSAAMAAASGAGASGSTTQ